MLKTISRRVCGQDVYLQGSIAEVVGNSSLEQDGGYNLHSTGTRASNNQRVGGTSTRGIAF